MLIKKIINKFASIIHKQRLNVCKTLVANFLFVPFNYAFKFPILIYGPCRVRGNGNVEFKGYIRKGMLKIGQSDAVRSCFEKTYLQIDGELFCGNNVIIRRGTKINITKTGRVTLDDNVFVSDSNTIISVCSIHIGSGTRIGNNTTFMDTDFHYIINTKTKQVRKSNSPIEIGENNWIGGNCIIKKGSKTPQGTILAGPFSMIGKNYIDKVPEYSIIGGSPAKLIVENMRRVNNDNTQLLLDKHFEGTVEPYQFSVNINLDKICLPE